MPNILFSDSEFSHYFFAQGTVRPVEAQAAVLLLDHDRYFQIFLEYMNLIGSGNYSPENV